MSSRFVIVVGLAVFGTAGAQTPYVVAAHPLLSHGADERLEAATLRAWYAELDRLGVSGAGAAALAEARARVPAPGNFETMRVRDARAMVAAHDALVDALALPPSERIACRREPLVGSHVPVVTCRVAGRDLAAAARDRDALR
jgi:hypothetical protein